jgi:hypothetical protein
LPTLELGHAKFVELGFGCVLYAAAAASDGIDPATAIHAKKGTVAPTAAVRRPAI